jgi:hypothetical protein
MKFSRHGLLTLLVCALPAIAHAQAARLQAGTHVTLQLAQHITSGQTTAGAPVWFRVKDDLKVGDGILVSKGTLVRGQMTASSQRGSIGSSGSMNFGVRFVPAVDGQNVRVIASLGSMGRDRGNALVGWTLMWGWFGLMTKGVDAYALRGSEMDAEVLSDKVIQIPATQAAAIDDSTDAGVAMAGHVVGKEHSKPVSLDFERFKRGSISFQLPGGSDRKKSPPAVQAARITAINGLAPPEPIESGTLSFDMWQLLQHCDDGANTLQFHLTTSEGEMNASYVLPVKFVLRKR